MPYTFIHNQHVFLRVARITRPGLQADPDQAHGVAWLVMKSHG